MDGISLFTSFVQIFYVWMAPFFLVWYLMAKRVEQAASGDRSEKCPA